MKDKFIVDERMKQFERDVLHWINYDYVVINDDLENVFKKQNLNKSRNKNGSKDYDKYIRNHIEKFYYLIFHSSQAKQIINFII